MKSTALFLALLFTTNASAVPTNLLLPRQNEALTSLLSTPKTPFAIKKLTPQFNPTATRELLIYGPFKLSPRKNNTAENSPTVLKLDANSDAFNTMISGVCTDCMVLSAQGKVVNQDGKKLDIDRGVYTHHVIMTDIGKQQSLNPAMVKCDNSMSFFGGFDSLNLIQVGGGVFGQAGHGGHEGGGKAAPVTLSTLAEGTGAGMMMLATGTLMTIAGTTLSALAAALLTTSTDISIFTPYMPRGASVFVGTGAEGTENVFAANSTTVKTGYYVQKQDKMLLQAEVVNYDPMAKDVYLSLEYEYIPHIGKEEGWLDVAMGAINVDGCARSATDAMKPAHNKASSFTSPEWIVIQDGYIVRLIPHMHDGGVNTKYYLNSKLICTSSAIYGGGEATTSLSTGEKWDTITGYTLCTEPVKITTGDKLVMSVVYDLTKYRLRPSSADHGKEAEAMGLGLVWFAKEIPKK